MPRLTRRSAWFAVATAALAVGALTERATSGNTVSFAHNAHPRVTNRCPVGALPLRRVDPAALRHFALELAPHGVKEAGSQDIDYSDAKAKASFPTFYSGYVHALCPARVAKRVIERTADVLVSYPHVNWSASLSYSVFLIVRTRHGLVGWAQMH